MIFTTSYKGEKNGWIFPSGMFRECPAVNHSKTAQNILEEQGWVKDYMDYEKTKCDGFTDLERIRKAELPLVEDFLIDIKGFVKVSNSFDQALIYCRNNRLSKQQLKTLFKLETNENQGLPDKHLPSINGNIEGLT